MLMLSEKLQNKFRVPEHDTEPCYCKQPYTTIYMPQWRIDFLSLKKKKKKERECSQSTSLPLYRIHTIPSTSSPFFVFCF